MENLLFLGVPIFKHFTVHGFLSVMCRKEVLDRKSVKEVKGKYPNLLISGMHNVISL